MNPNIIPSPLDRIPIMTGRDFPMHLRKAFGRYVFRLLHTGQKQPGLYLRDLPMGLHDLGAADIPEPLAEYRKECARTHTDPFL